MLDIFSGLRLVVKRRSISIDNAIFRCHWFFTSTLLVSFSLIITARQYVGQPIECHSVNKLPDSLLNSYCWVQSTFTVPQACNKHVGLEVPYPCIDNSRGNEIKMFAYYQWVGIVLFIQGLLFHLPYYLWKVWENGLIKAITGGLRVAVINDQDRIKKKDVVVEYILDHLGCHKSYALKYFLCEFICLINLLLQLWATNKFFDGQFLKYGLDVMQYSSSSISGQLGYNSPLTSNVTLMKLAAEAQSTRYGANSMGRSKSDQFAQALKNQPSQTVDPMTYIFPRITKCTYYDFGSSGDIQKHDALCLLPLNIINEKIYIALWFWFIILALLTVLVIFYRIFAIISENVRCKGLISRCKLSQERDIRIICRHCDVGDWFLFYMVAENLDPLIMRELIADIANTIRVHFDKKRDLGIFRDEGGPENDRDSMYKFRPPTSNQQQLGFSSYSDSCSDETSLLSRRNSLAINNNTLDNGELPFVKKFKKRLYNKRLWSVDLSSSGASDVRQHLFGRQQSLNLDSGSIEERPVQVSAPPASQMPLNSAALLSRREHFTRTASSRSGSNSQASTEDTFVLEMQPICHGSNSQLNANASASTTAPTSAKTLVVHRRLSSQGADSMGTRPKLRRQQSLNQSLRELRFDSRHKSREAEDEIEILESA